MKVSELALPLRQFLKSRLCFSKLVGERLICFLDLVQPSCHMWRTSKFNNSVGGCQYEEQLLFMVSHFFNNPFATSFALCVLNLNVLIQLVCFFRFTQIVMTLTSCGQDLTSSLTHYAAFKTSRRSTTFPGMIECSNVCSVLSLFAVL